MRFRRKQMIEVEATEHTRADCDLGGCDICLSYWELLDLMLPDGPGVSETHTDPKEAP